MPIRSRRINTGQPSLDGRTCYSCTADAVHHLLFERGNHSTEIRLCDDCAEELRDILIRFSVERDRPHQRAM